MTRLLDFNPLHNFISPVTGRILSPLDYVPYGDLGGVATPSPILIDIRLDLIKLQQEIDDIQKLTPFPSEVDFIIGSPSSSVPNAQVLSNLADGYLYNTSGILSSIPAGPLPSLAEGQLWIGNANNEATAVQRISIDNLPTLTTNYIWIGDANGLPVEAELSNSISLDATFILQQPNINIPNGQALSLLGTGMTKIVGVGEIAIAIPDEDYATVATLERIKNETEVFKDEAAASASEATTAAEEATAAATEATGAASEATAAASAASSSAAAAAASALTAGAEAIAAGLSASSASSSANDAEGYADDASNSADQAQTYLNELLNTGINLTGDVVGSGPLSQSIDLSFAPNPTFTGNSFMIIPVGTTSQRPNNPVIGMVRINTEL